MSKWATNNSSSRPTNDNISSSRPITNNTSSAVKPQVGGKHYQIAIQPADYIFYNRIPYLEGNVIKYVTRHRDKNREEDIKKAIHYLAMILDREYKLDVENKIMGAFLDET